MGGTKTGRGSAKYDPKLGIFVKTPDVAIIEVLAETSIGFVVLDQEHAPLDRRSLDLLLFAARALDLPAFVRVPDCSRASAQAALDGGAAGILFPHISDAQTAAAAASVCRYGSGRGYSGAVRCMRRQPDILSATATADAAVMVVAQVEDPAGVEAAADIAACSGIDALFIGRADLAACLGAANSDAPEVWAAAKRIADSAAMHGKALWAFASNWADADRLSKLGAKTLIFGSDQSRLKQSVSELAAAAAQRTRSGESDPDNRS